jgi:hypothetical protein
MRRVLICTGVLGGGSALTFAIAALAASLAPPGPLVYGQYGQPWAMDMVRGGMVKAVPMPAPVWIDSTAGPGVVFEESGAGGSDLVPVPEIDPAPDLVPSP